MKNLRVLQVKNDDSVKAKQVKQIRVVKKEDFGSDPLLRKEKTLWGVLCKRYDGTLKLSEHLFQTADVATEFNIHPDFEIVSVFPVVVYI